MGIGASPSKLGEARPALGGEGAAVEAIAAVKRPPTRALCVSTTDSCIHRRHAQAYRALARPQQHRDNQRDTGMIETADTG